MASPTPAMIAREHLAALHTRYSGLGSQLPPDKRVEVGMLACLVAIADSLAGINRHLDGIEKSLELGITVHGGP